MSHRRPQDSVHSWPWSGVLRRLVETRGSESQLAQYVAVLSGIRRSLDDWISAERFEVFVGLMKELNLVTRIDCTFVAVSGHHHIVGIDRVPTTYAVGTRFVARTVKPGSLIHIFVSGRTDWAEEAVAAGWYSVGVGARVLRKPLVDHARLGRAFGYPDCCIRFFVLHNNWGRFNTIAEAVRQSRKICWQTNCLLHHTPWMALFHIPCAFDCITTIHYTKQVIGAVSQLDSGYAATIMDFLKLPALVISEDMAYSMFDAQVLSANRIKYEGASFLGGKKRTDRYGVLLNQGDEVIIEEGTMIILRDGRISSTIQTHCDRGVIEAPQILVFEG